MSLEWEQAVIDTCDPVTLGRWWAEALGWDIVNDDIDDFEIRDPSGRLPGIIFERVSETKQTKNRVHLDFRPRDQEEEVRRLLDLGAARVDVGQGDVSWVVLADPEGNEFCVLEASPQPGIARGLTTHPMTDGDLDDAIRFIRSANPFAEHTWGWETGRFLDWRWGGNTLRDRTEPGFFERNGTIIRDETNAIAALVIAEQGAEVHCILTASEDAGLFAAALSWLLESRDGQPTVFYPSDGATWLHDVLAAQGLERGDVQEVGWGYDLTKLDELAATPEAFVIDQVSGESDYPEIARCLEGAFGGVGGRIAVLHSLAGNPRYRPELSIVARSADGRIASYCRGTIDLDSGVGSIDPIATHPDFQGLGLGRAIVLACFAAQARLGGREIYIGSGPEGSAGSRLYRKLDPVSKITYSEWSRPAL